MDYYNNTLINHLNSRTVVEDAYRAAGLPVPSSVDAISERLSAEPTMYDVAVDYAKRTMSADHDAEAFVAEAIEAIQRAAAIQTFRDIYERTIEQVALENIENTRKLAVEDLAGPFARVVKMLQRALTKLDPANPLDQQIAFDNDTTAEYRAAVAALSSLGAYAIAPASSTIGPDNAMHPLLPIVKIPTIPYAESFIPDSAFGGEPIRDEYSPARDAIQQVRQVASKSKDEAIIRIARGEFPGVALHLATPEELIERSTSYDNTRRRVRQGSGSTLV